MSDKTMNFDSLVAVIEQTHKHFQQQAVKAVNVSLTVRNYLIGFYIVEFEQNGEDRAAYGEKLLQRIADRIAIGGLSKTNLKLSRQFYKTYPEIGAVLQSSFINLLPSSIGQIVTDQFQASKNKIITIGQMPSDDFKYDSNSLETDKYFQHILERISFSHFIELIKIEDKTKRTFYELLILKTTPSVT